MKLTSSDTSFHNKIMSRYRKEKRYRFMFPSMLFLRSEGKYLSRIIDIHVRLNLQIHHKYMGLSSVLLQKFHDMKLIFSSLRTEKQILREVSNRSKETSILSKMLKATSGFYEINKILINGTRMIFEIPSFRIENKLNEWVLFHKENNIHHKENNIYRIMLHGVGQTFNYPLTVADYFFTRTEQANYQKSNYLQSINNVTLSRTPKGRTLNFQTVINIFSHSDGVFNNLISNYGHSMNVRTFNYPLTADSKYFTQAKHFKYQDSDYPQTINNIFSNTGILNDIDSVNHSKIENLQSPDARNNFTLKHEKHYNTVFRERMNFWKKMEINRIILKSNIRTTLLPYHIEDYYPGTAFNTGINSLDLAYSLKPRQNGINGPNNDTTGADIVFKKTYHENKITGETKLNDEKTISAKIRADRQIKNVSPQILQGEISSIANKVYKLLERRLSIEKEKRGAHIIG